MIKRKCLSIKALLFSLLLFQNIYSFSQESDTSYFVPWDDNYNLLLAVDRSDTASVSLLLTRGANVNTTTSEGVTPLMFAADNGNLQMVRFLTDKGADINRKPYSGATALMAAVKNNHYDVAEFLASRKVEFNTRDVNGVTALIYAAAFNNFDILDMLVFYGADLELGDNRGNTPLMVAAYNNCIESADLLLQNGANIDATDNDGFTALMTAIERGNNDMAFMLMDKGADIHAVNHGGFSALIFAVTNSNYEITEALLNMGADVDQRTEAGFTSLEIASLNKSDDIVELLKINEARKNFNPRFNTLSTGPFFDFNFTDYMNGIGLSLNESRYLFSINSGFGFRPVANRVLMEESDTLSIQYWEKRNYFYAGIEKKFNLLNDPANSTGPYLALSEFLTFGGYRGSDTNPPLTLLTVPSAGWHYSNRGMTTWAGYQFIQYNAHDIKPGRIVVGISAKINLTKKRLTRKRISWLES